MQKGWFKVERSVFEDPILMCDSETFTIWCYLLAHAAYTPRQAEFRGKPIVLKPGQLITGRKVIARTTKINESKVTRALQKLQNAQRIEQQTSNANRLISILGEPCFFQSEQQIEQQANNKRTTNEQQANTYIERMNDYNYKRNTTRAWARTGIERLRAQSIFSSDASYDLEEYERSAIGLRGYKPIQTDKANETKD